MNYDITVIGGGIAGAGVAQAASAAGYKVLLLEKGEFAQETSSRSSKLIHGGLRYLESGQFHLVYTALKARRELLKLAPELVKPVPFYIPVYQHSQRGTWTLSAGLMLYGLLCFGDPLCRFKRLNKNQWHKLQGLDKTGLKAVYQYWDAQTDDEQLTLSVLESAKKLGCSLHTHAELLTVSDASSSTGSGYELSYQINSSHSDKNNKAEANAMVRVNSPTQQTISTRMIINASGPWVNKVLDFINPNIPQSAIDWVQGTHIIIDEPALDFIYYLESIEDERVVFVMPWKGKTMIGTTEVVLKQLPNSIEPQAHEIAYLMNLYQHYFPEKEINMLSAFSGVRVLPKVSSNAFNRERESVIAQSCNAKVITLYGGKLTTFRATSKAVLKLMEQQLGSRKPKANVDNITLEKVKT